MGVGVGLAVAGLLGAGGMIGGSLLSDSTTPGGALTNVAGNPLANPVTSALAFDALTPLGFADAANISSPIEQVIDLINRSPVNDKQKRRGRMALAALANQPELWRQGMTRRERYEAFEQLREQPGISGVGGLLAGAGSLDFEKGLIVSLAALGMTIDDLPDLFARNEQFKQDREALSEFQGLQTDRVLQRAQQAQTINNLTSAASRFADTGETDPTFNAFLDRLNRISSDQEETALLRAQNAGLRPGDISERFSVQRQENPLLALGQVLQTAGTLQGLYSEARRPAETTLGLTGPQQSNALNTAASQANIANQLLYQGNAAENAALGTGVSAAAGVLGDSIRDYYGYQLASQGAAPAFNPNATSGSPVVLPGTTGPQATQFRVTTPYYGS